MYVCLCFGVTEQQVHAQIEAGASSPRQIASACKAGTDCGSCVRRIQALLGRPTVCSRRGAAAKLPAQGSDSVALVEEQPEIVAEAVKPAEAA